MMVHRGGYDRLLVKKTVVWGGGGREWWDNFLDVKGVCRRTTKGRQQWRDHSSFPSLTSHIHLSLSFLF